MKTQKQRIAKQKRNDDKLRELALIRSGGRCEICGQLPDFRGLSIHHNPPKGMGGTTHIYTLDEVKMLCGGCHDKITNHEA